jgi:putative ABC transport system permease protein
VTVVSRDVEGLRSLRSAPGVVASAGPFPQTVALLHVRASLERSAVLRTAPQERPAVDRPLVRGRWLGGTDEIVVERSFARSLEVGPGAVVTVSVGPGAPLRLRVAGIAVTAGRGPFPDWSPGLAWVTSAAFARVVPAGASVEQFLALRLTSGASSYDAVDEARRALPDARTFTWQQVEEDVLEDARTTSTVLGALSALSLLAVALILANVVAGRVLSRRRDLAVLRALGATPGHISALLVGQHAGLAVAAGTLGSIGALVLGQPLLDRAADVLAGPAASPVVPAVAAVGIVAGAAALFSLPAALRARRIPPMRALHGEPAGRGPRRSRIAATGAWLRFPVPVVVGLQDTLARRGRALLSVLSLMLTVAIVVFALGMEATYDRILADPAIDGAPFQLRIFPGALGENTTQALLARHRDQIASHVTIARLPATANGDGLQLRAFGGAIAAQPYNVTQGRMPRSAGETMIAPGITDATGVHVGDRLTVAVRDRRLILRVVGSYVDPSQDGRVVVVTRATLDQARIPIPPPAHALTVRAGVDPHVLASQLDRETRGLADVQVTSDLYSDERDALRPVVWGLVVVLLAVGLVNLLTTTLLTARERARDLAVLKTLGMTPAQLYAGTAAGAALLAVTAVALGVPLGLAMFDALVLLLNPIDGQHILTHPQARSLAALLPATIALACLAALLPARAITRARITTGLRQE